MSVPKAKKKKSPLKKADPHDIIRLTNEVNMAVNIRIMRQVYGFGKKRLQDYIEAYTSLLMELADGRNTARKLDDGATLEIYRNCTDGTRNACTKLYGACVRIARDMGYKKVITYTLESENGASLRAANFTFAGSAGGIAWTGTRRRDYYVSPEEMKNRWEYVL